MKRAWPGFVGIALTLLSATGQADEIEWRAVPTLPQAAPPRDGAAIHRAALVEAPPPGRIDHSPTWVSSSPAAATPTEPPANEPLGQPRKEKENPIPGAGSWGSGIRPADAKSEST